MEIGRDRDKDIEIERESEGVREREIEKEGSNTPLIFFPHHHLLFSLILSRYFAKKNNPYLVC